MEPVLVEVCAWHLTSRKHQIFSFVGTLYVGHSHNLQNQIGCQSTGTKYYFGDMRDIIQCRNRTRRKSIGRPHRTKTRIRPIINRCYQTIWGNYRILIHHTRPAQVYYSLNSLQQTQHRSRNSLTTEDVVLIWWQTSTCESTTSRRGAAAVCTSNYTTSCNASMPLSTFEGTLSASYVWMTQTNGWRTAPIWQVTYMLLIVITSCVRKTFIQRRDNENCDWYHQQSD